MFLMNVVKKKVGGGGLDLGVPSRQIESNNSRRCP